MNASKPLGLFVVFSLVSLCQADSWPSWRGDLLGSGVTPETDLPLKWSPEENVTWRVELPEGGNSTPIVLEDRVFVTQPITAEKWRGLYCFDRETGELLWKNGLVYDKEERTHRTNLYCSASPVTDGEIVVTSYGSAGLVAYDLNGNQLWHRDLGALDHTWGNSSSPLIYGGLIIHYHGPAKNAVLYGFDKKSGETVWQWKEPIWTPGERTDGFQGRSDEGVIGAFSTPILIEGAERDELVMSFPMEMKGFNPRNGQELWTASGLNPLVYTSPMYNDGMVVAMGGYYGNSVGVRIGGEGDVTSSHRQWQEVRHNGGIGTGVMHDGHYYYHNSGGVVFCDDVKTGKTVWKDRLPLSGKSWGSLLLSGDKIYTLSQAGDTVVFKASPEGMEVLAENSLNEHTNSSLAPSQGSFFVRTHEALWRIDAGN
ncbi:MAG: PQQ-binding-like beta-propeller repeat protein [Verrucomicrobiota bacterium]